MKITIEKIKVRAKPRKLARRWRVVEGAPVHEVHPDVVDELAKILSEEIVKEISAEWAVHLEQQHLRELSRLRDEHLQRKYPPIYGKIILPIIRKIIPNLIATELCGVQPMQESSGELFTVKVDYATTFTSHGLPTGATLSSPGETAPDGRSSPGTVSGSNNSPSLWHDSRSYEVRSWDAIAPQNLVTATSSSSSPKMTCSEVNC